MQVKCLVFISRVGTGPWALTRQSPSSALQRPADRFHPALLAPAASPARGGDGGPTGELPRCIWEQPQDRGLGGSRTGEKLRKQISELLVDIVGLGLENGNSSQSKYKARCS